MASPTPTLVPLREWIDRALLAVDASSLANDSFLASFGPDPTAWAPDIRRSLALPSEAYLVPALKVARALADQLCQVEHAREYEHNDGSQQPHRALPRPGSDWAAMAAVHLSTIERGMDAYEGDLMPLPFGESGSDPTDLQDMLNSILPDPSVFEREDAGAEAEGEAVSCFDVVGAEIMPPPQSESYQVNTTQRNSQNIWSLGMVLYELFSGGEQHPDAARQLQSTTNRPGMNEFSEIEAASCEPLAHGHAGAIDLSGALNILNEVDISGVDLASALHDFDNVQGPAHASLGSSNGTQHPKKRRESSIGSARASTPSASTERLQLKGLPVALCDLVANMLDAIHGDLSSHEAYQSMTDVRQDLQLMLDKPHTYLYDMDFDKVSMTGLPLHEAMFGRDLEYATLQAAYQRSIAGESEMALISGPSGIGKSVLAQRVGTFITMKGGAFVAGKFDRLQSATPFSALAAAFNRYCDELSIGGGGRPGRLEEVAAMLRRALTGEERAILTRVIPSLNAVIGPDASQIGVDEGCVDAQKRLQYLLCKFVGAISSIEPVCLFLDDMQWSDPASIRAIHQLILGSGPLTGERKFFFLGSCREEGLVEGHPFGSMVSKVCQIGLRLTSVELDCVDKETTNAMVSELLCLPPRLTRTLSELIHHKTKGNMLFFAKLMTSLSRDEPRLLRLSLSRRRWEWNEEKIQMAKLPDDVATFMSFTIEKLPDDVQMSLSLLSCFGASANISTIEALEARLGMPIFDSLEKAVSEGIVDKIHGKYSFSHDKLQEACYNMMKPEEQCLFHFKYGVALVSCYFQLEDDDMLFIAAGQLNRGGPKALEDDEQAVLIANLNLTAGKKAMEMSNYSAAYNYFDHGISFLPRKHWINLYDVSLELYEIAAKCALFNGDTVSLKILSDQVLTKARCFEDTFEVLCHNIKALAYASEIAESVKLSMSVLSQLGEELPESNYGDTKFFIEQTNILLQGFTEQQLIDYKLMEDETKIRAMKIYARLETSLQMIKPSSQPLVTVKMVQLSIARGLSVFSPIAFTYFGQLLAKLGDIREGYKYVKIAQKMMERMSMEVAGDVIGTGTQIRCFVEPVQACLEHHIEGHATAMAVGDTHGALFNLALNAGGIFWAGTKLCVCKEVNARARRLMKEHNHFTWLAHVVPVEKNVLILMGSQENERRLTGDQGEQDLRDAREANSHASFTQDIQTMVISFIFRNYADTKATAEKVFDYNLHTWPILYIHTGHSFYKGLVSWWIYRESKDPVWSERGRKAKQELEHWAQFSQHNFQSQARLLQAEEQFSNNDLDNARVSYEKAIIASKEHRFVNVEAHSCELAGHFFLDSDEKDTALGYFMRAHEKYHEWGAVAKSNALFESVQRVLDPNASVSADALPLPTLNGDGFSNDKGPRKRTSDTSD